MLYEVITDAAAYYVDQEGIMHFIAVQKGNARIVINAKTKEGVMSLARKALDAMK